MNLVVVVGEPAEGMPPATLPAIRVRPASRDDRAFALALVPRLAMELPAHWRRPQQVLAAYAVVVESLFETRADRSTLLVGLDVDTVPFGVALLLAASDGWSPRARGHLVQVAVATGPHGAPSVRALHDAATAWARASGYAVLAPADFRNGLPACVFCRDSETIPQPKEAAR
ncbi:MAG TPA: hypothetical protein VGH80_08460 [Xanthomonadaceae bacterium]|jgi:hypothetical protein